MNTNKKKSSFNLILCLLITFILFLTDNSYAHPGKTDAAGGHYNRKTGVYHYHTHTPSPTNTPKASSPKASEASPTQEESTVASSAVASSASTPESTVAAPLPTSTPLSSPSSSPKATASSEASTDNFEKRLIPSKLSTSLFYASLGVIALCAAALLLLYCYYTYFIKKAIKLFIFQPDTKKIKSVYIPTSQINIPYKKYLDEDNFLYGYIGAKNGNKTIIIITKEKWLSLISQSQH